jgi:hypothetical protein
MTVETFLTMLITPIGALLLAWFVIWLARKEY